MRLFKGFLAGICSLSLALSLSGGALAAERNRAAGFTLGVYVTAGLSANCYSRSPLTGEETGENYLRYLSAAVELAEENEANLFFDLGNTAEDLPGFPARPVEPMALCLRQGSFVFASGTWEEALPDEDRQQLESILTDHSDTYPGRDVDTLWSLESREQQDVLVIENNVGLGLDRFEVRILRLEEAARWEESGENSGDLVIALAPSGTWDADSLARQVAQTKSVDLVLVGSGGESLPARLSNAEGKEVPLAGGKGATELRLTVSRTGALSFGRPAGLDLAEYPCDPELEELLLSYYEADEALAEQEIGTLAGEWDQVTGLFQAQSDTMNLIHESRLWATGAELSLTCPSAEPGFSVGGLLEGSRVGPITLRDCYAACRSQSPVWVVEMTGTQLKDWLEECAKDYSVGPNNVVLGGGAGTDQLYGMSYEIYLGNPEGQRVTNMTYQGKPVTDQQRFRVAVDADRLKDEADPYGWYAVTGIAPKQAEQPEGIMPGGARLRRDNSAPMLLAEYIKALTAREERILPPQAQSRWVVSAATSAEALAPVSRLGFVEILYEAAGRPTAYLDLHQTFADMPGENPAAAWAVQAGIVVGNGSGQFLPDTLVSREQAAVMLLRYDTARGAGPEGSWGVRVPYTDAADTAAWASEALMWNVIRGYLLPDGGGRLKPQSALTVADLEYAIGQLGK